MTPQEKHLKLQEIFFHERREMGHCTAQILQVKVN